VYIGEQPRVLAASDSHSEGGGEIETTTSSDSQQWETGQENKELNFYNKPCVKDRVDEL
jgi:hypothetical protein